MSQYDAKRIRGFPTSSGRKQVFPCQPFTAEWARVFFLVLFSRFQAYAALNSFLGPLGTSSFFGLTFISFILFNLTCVRQLRNQKVYKFGWIIPLFVKVFVRNIIVIIKLLAIFFLHQTLQVSFPGVWVTASLVKSPGLFCVFCSVSKSCSLDGLDFSFNF